MLIIPRSSGVGLGFTALRYRSGICVHIMCGNGVNRVYALRTLIGLTNLVRVERPEVVQAWE